MNATTTSIEIDEALTTVFDAVGDARAYPTWWLARCASGERGAGCHHARPIGSNYYPTNQHGAEG